MKNKKMKTMIASLALVGVVGLGSTLAYLSDKSNTLTNSFTVGTGYNEDDKLKQAVWIDEEKIGTVTEDANKLYSVDVNGVSVMRTLEGNQYVNVLAGSTLTKDPVLRVNTGSVKSYAYIKVEGLDALKDKEITTVINKEWVKVLEDGKTPDNSKGLDGIYRYKDVLDPTNKVAATTPLFNELNVSAKFEVEANGEKVELDTVVLKGCAVQAVTTVNGEETPIALADSDAPVFE